MKSVKSRIPLLALRVPVALPVTLLLFVLMLPAPATVQEKVASTAQLQSIQAYIRQTWHTLTRSSRHLAEAAVDPKFHPLAGGRWPVYVDSAELPAVERSLRAEMPAEDFARIVLLALPSDPEAITEPGLLYLPFPYVVPGGRFNEMYGWDSYFIQVGLLRDGDLQLARDMIGNFLYEIKHYGRVLNANRTYYLMRSQPPFLTQMILGVYEKTHDRDWLAQTIPEIENYYRYWTDEPHLTGETGLSHYYALGNGPAPEVVSGEKDASGRTEYDRVKEYFRTHKITAYDVSQYYDKTRNRLTPLFYKADRSMRESGFDPSDRFGPFGADIIHYDPVDLNSLLYIMETQAARIQTILGRKDEADRWLARADARRSAVNRLMWDEKDGLYYDYDFVKKRVRRYPFLTTFYPLWAGIADQRQAERIVSKLPLFERAGGLQTSTHVSGDQWDAPFGWAPLEMIAVQGLRRYGYNQEADRITANFLSMILDQFLRYHNIVEKYDVVRRTSRLGAALKYGYTTNEAGFGWTNAAFTELYGELSEKAKPEVLELNGIPVPSHAKVN